MPAMTGNQPGLFSEFTENTFTGNLQKHCHGTEEFVPVASLSLLTFCVILAELLPIKPFITSRRRTWLIQLDAVVTC